MRSYDRCPECGDAYDPNDGGCETCKETPSSVVVNLKMEGSKSNQAKVQRLVASAVNEALQNMNWHFLGEGNVEVKWEIAIQ